jgi:hypothetical protein
VTIVLVALGSLAPGALGACFALGLDLVYLALAGGLRR